MAFHLAPPHVDPVMSFPITPDAPSLSVSAHEPAVYVRATRAILAAKLTAVCMQLDSRLSSS